VIPIIIILLIYLQRRTEKSKTTVKTTDKK